MSESNVLDVVKKLIVGRRGRGRADRLVCFGADNRRVNITVKPQTNASRYVDIVAGCNPVRIEAYAGDEMVDAWGEAVQAAPARAAPRAAAKKTAAAAAKKKGPRSWRREVIAIATHTNNLIASAYTTNNRTNADKEKALWEALRVVAQHHADRAAHAEARADQAEKGIRIRDRNIIELNNVILKMNAKIQEVAASSDGDERTNAFMKLLEIAKTNAPAPAAETNGAAKKGKA